MHGGATIRQGDSELEEQSNIEAPQEPEMEFEEFDVELCPVCGEELQLRRNSSGPVMVCKAYPKCRYTQKV